MSNVFVDACTTSFGNITYLDADDTPCWTGALLIRMMVYMPCFVGQEHYSFRISGNQFKLPDEYKLYDFKGKRSWELENMCSMASLDICAMCIQWAMMQLVKPGCKPRFLGLYPGLSGKYDPFIHTYLFI